MNPKPTRAPSKAPAKFLANSLLDTHDGSSASNSADSGQCIRFT